MLGRSPQQKIKDGGAGKLIGNTDLSHMSLSRQEV